MKAVEFTTELTGAGILTIPSSVTAQLPKSGIVRVILLTQEMNDDAAWNAGAYEQFLREDPAEDSIYDSQS